MSCFVPGKWPGFTKWFYTYYHCFLINENLTTIISAGLILALAWQTSEIKIDLSNDLVQSPHFFFFSRENECPEKLTDLPRVTEAVGGSDSVGHG